MHSFETASEFSRGAHQTCAQALVLVHKEKINKPQCCDSTPILFTLAGVLLGTVAGRRCAPLDKICSCVCFPQFRPFPECKETKTRQISSRSSKPGNCTNQMFKISKIVENKSNTHVQYLQDWKSIIINCGAFRIGQLC